MLGQEKTEEIDACATRILLEVANSNENARDLQGIWKAVAALLKAAFIAAVESQGVQGPQNAIDAIPGEVLAAIFEQLSVLDRLAVPLVCSRWRAAALGYPRVWSSVELASTVDKDARLLQLVLSRAGTCAIDLKCLKIPPFRGICRPLLAIVTQNMGRMRSIEWHGAFEPGCFSQSAPLLKRLRCTGSGTIGAWFLGGVEGVLRELEVTPKMNLERDAALPCAFKNLTRLETALDDADVAALFAACPNLLDLTLDVSFVSGVVPAATLPPFLRFLRLSVRRVFSLGLMNAEVMSAWGIWRVPHAELFGLNAEDMMLRGKGDMLRDMPAVRVEGARVVGENVAWEETHLVPA